MTIPPSGPRRKDALATRERLVRAALELFTTHGYRATTTLDIAARARIAEATIYRHFVGKEALFNEAYRQALRWGISAVKAVEVERIGTRERLERLARAIAEQATRDPSLAIMLVRRQDGAALEDPTAQLAREQRDGLTQLIAAGKQEGTIRPGSADLWSAVWMALVTFVVEKMVAREWSPDHVGVGATIEAAWDAISQRRAPTA